MKADYESRDYTVEIEIPAQGKDWNELCIGKTAVRKRGDSVTKTEE